jgi:hypothetical protein
MSVCFHVTVAEARYVLNQQPPDMSEVWEALDCVVGDADRAGNIIGRIQDQVKKAGASIRAWFRSPRSYERKSGQSTKQVNSSKAGAVDATLIDPVELATAN